MTKRLTVLETVAAGTAAAFTHTLPLRRRKRRIISKSGRLRVQLRLLPEDSAFAQLIAEQYAVSPAEVIAHCWTLTCRALRTGRDPLTGEPIDWKAVAYADDIPLELRDFLAESAALIAHRRKKKRIPLFD